MSFRISGLPVAQFSHLFGLDEVALQAHGAQRHLVTEAPGFPDRIALRDATPGEYVLLLNYQHQPTNNPYRSSHAIFVIEGAAAHFDQIDTVPEPLRIRTISLRAFDEKDEMVDADLVQGEQLAARIEEFFTDKSVHYLHAHYAKRGCYAARVDRALDRI